MATTNTWDQVVSKITGVANRGAFSKTYTPSTSRQTQNGSAGYYSSITTVCNAVSLSGNASTSHVLSGKTFYTTSLTRQTGTMANRGNLNWSPSGSSSYSVPAGYYSGGTLNSSSAYNSGYNNGVNAGKQTMGSTLQYVHSVSMGQNDPYYGSYTATSAGYYLVIACATGTGDNNKKRTITISTTGTSRSYVRYWINDNGYSTTQTGCRQAIGVMICYMNSGNTVSYMLDTDYNTTEFCIIFKLG